MNLVNMRDKNFDIRLICETCNIIMLTCNILMLHGNINDKVNINVTR